MPFMLLLDMLQKLKLLKLLLDKLDKLDKPISLKPLLNKLDQLKPLKLLLDKLDKLNEDVSPTDHSAARTFGGLLALQDNTGLTTRISEWKGPIKKYLIEQLGPDFDSLQLYNAEAERWEEYDCDTIRTVRSAERILCRCGNVPDDDDMLQREIILARCTPRRGIRPWKDNTLCVSPTRKDSISPGKVVHGTESKSTESKSTESKSTESKSTESKSKESKSKESKKNEKKRRANSRGSESSELNFVDVTPVKLSARDTRKGDSPTIVELSSDSEAGTVQEPSASIGKAKVRMSAWPGARSFRQVRDAYYAVEDLQSKEGIPLEEAVLRVTYVEVPRATWYQNVGCLAAAKRETREKFYKNADQPWKEFRLEVNARRRTKKQKN
ncbi:hypothetical protein CALVIDRAFT_566929 [Calocera viscosa TUFC12733]|uniref:Uncharacterized protein n=1 Tax=Calocera viscosa (strain TUFC12733) TaxID=1330018 RepID=A0A167IW27_CALVF|nr:hypothetical protein CALVIDRAFT_566929 [Calocera viscosa TUFC12733]